MSICLVVLAAALAAAPDPLAYPITPEQRQANEARVAADRTRAPAPWPAAPFVYYEVPPLAGVPRLPDAFPADGRFLGPLRIASTPGEFEPASFVVYPFRQVARLELKAGDLKGDAGTIPAAALDLKIVKVWYQAGSAWYGFYNDRTRRVPVPELLLNDETLVRADHATKDNYIRYTSGDGQPRYAWMSFPAGAVNHTGRGQANLDLIEDSPVLLPAALEPGEFKQFMVTAAVPADAKPGLYRGGIALVADGAPAGTVPVALRVLPFTLPRPATWRDGRREFYGSVYCQPLELDKPGMLKNLRDHNILNPMLPRAAQAPDEAAFGKMLGQLKAAGLSTKPLFAAGPLANLQVQSPPTEEQQGKLKALQTEAAESVAMAGKFAGHREIYSYGRDEGGPSVIFRERSTWRAVHEAGGKVMVSSFPHGRLLYGLDYLIIPGSPTDRKRKAVEAWHAANPDGLAAWYADPHSGPENPDYFRRVHGLMAWKAGYDAICNYVWYRNNWNDFWVPDESNMRGLMMVYPGKDRVIDTLAWEGVREGLDDIRYGTLLRSLAAQAIESGNAEARDEGRRALGWITYWDETREDLPAARLEMIGLILRLQEVVKGGRP